MQVKLSVHAYSGDTENYVTLTPKAKISFFIQIFFHLIKISLYLKDLLKKNTKSLEEEDEDDGVLWVQIFPESAG